MIGTLICTVAPSVENDANLRKMPLAESFAACIPRTRIRPSKRRILQQNATRQLASALQCKRPQEHARITRICVEFGSARVFPHSQEASSHTSQRFHLHSYCIS